MAMEVNGSQEEATGGIPIAYEDQQQQQPPPLLDKQLYYKGQEDQGPSRVVVVESVATWDDILRQANAEGSLVAVHFSADWCAPCKFMAPIFDDLSKSHPDTTFLQVDVDDLQEIAKRMGVKAMPTFIFIKDEEQVDKFVGANREELEKRLVQFGQSTA